MGANRIESRELDNAVVERAAFVCCDSKEQARIEAGDLVEPVERGVLDWLEVHELSEVVSGEVTGRAHDDDIVLFKSLGIAAETWPLRRSSTTGLARREWASTSRSLRGRAGRPLRRGPRRPRG